MLCCEQFKIYLNIFSIFFAWITSLECKNSFFVNWSPICSYPTEKLDFFENIRFWAKKAKKNFFFSIVFSTYRKISLKFFIIVINYSYLNLVKSAIFTKNPSTPSNMNQNLIFNFSKILAKNEIFLTLVKCSFRVPIICKMDWLNFGDKHYLLFKKLH